MILLHELGHAVDDFAARRYYLGVSNSELGMASDLLIPKEYWYWETDYSKQPRFYMQTYAYLLKYNGHRSVNGFLLSAEIFTSAVIVYVLGKHDPTIKDGLLAQDEGAALYNIIEQFMNEYPAIPDVDLRNQFQTKSVPPLLWSKPGQY